MKRILSLIAVGFWLLAPVMAKAAKTTYVFTDHRFHFVKRMELKPKELKQRGEAQHPSTFSEAQIHNLLSGIRLNRKHFMSKKTTELDVFDKAHIDWMAPHLVKAFQDVRPNEEVVFSVITPQGKFLIRDDRLTIVRAWVQADGLHLYFRKLMAKVPNNYDKLSDVSQAMNRAEGLRVALELGEGQEYGKSTEELILQIPSAEKLAVQMPEAAPAKKAKAASPSPSAEERLKELKNLKEKGLISDKEYEAKKMKILKDL